MNRIAIITWLTYRNYGTLLQAYALQYYLKNKGYNNAILNDKTIIPKPSKKKALIRRIALFIIRKRKIFNKIKLKNDALFEQFKRRYIQVDYNVEDLLGIEQRYDTFICGSDQIWNPFFLKYKHYSAYWLDFGDDKVKRIAYAASYGTDECPPSLQGKLMRQLARFDAISVREESGIAISAEAGRQAAHVLDPTLLLSMDDYFTLTANVPARKSPYIYIYSINIANKEDIRWSEFCTFATEQHFSPIVTPASGYLPGRELFEDVEYCYATIPQWISLIQHSKLVVTTSFHGVVFSILLHKHFVYFPLSGTNSKGNSRVLNLLSKVGLSECVWREKGDYYRIYNLCIDWINVEKCLSDLRLCSYIFLKKGLA